MLGSGIMLDCHVMNHPNSGLYHYCVNLGNHVDPILQEQGMPRLTVYVPPHVAGRFKPYVKEIKEKRWHGRTKPFLWNCKLWHAPFQSGRIIPQKKRGLKILLTVHDLNPLHEGRSREEQINSLSYTQSLIDNSDALVCISEFCKQDVLKHLEVKVPVYVVHNGMSVLGTPALLPTSYRPLRPFLFSLGYVNRKKNLGAVLPLLKDEDLELVIAGKLDESDYIDTILEAARRLGVIEKLMLVGSVTDEEKAWYLQNCMAYLQPSLAEGFGLPVVEAMAFGKPLFLSNRTALPEIGGDVAFYFQNFQAEHMRQVFHEGMRQYALNGLSEKIISRAQLFNWDAKAREYVSVYKELLSDI
jgi:glycosyltransferase involved in cell wall biosynthesis